MTRQFKLADLALDQLMALEDYIAGVSSPEVAEQYVESIIDYSKSLTDRPS